MKRRDEIKITSRRDHPVFLLLFIIGIVFLSQESVQENLLRKDSLLGLGFFGFLILGLSAQIHQEISISKGMFSFKSRGSETKFDIHKVDVTCISRWLIIRQDDVLTQIDLKYFSKSQRRKILEHLGKEGAAKRQSDVNW